MSGEELASEMLKALREANESAQATRELLIEVRDGMARQLKAAKATVDALGGVADRMEVLLVASDILGDVARNGSHISIKDFVKAIQSADQEVFGEGGEEGDGAPEDDGDDDDGDPQPAIPGRRRHKGV